MDAEDKGKSFLKVVFLPTEFKGKNINFPKQICIDSFLVLNYLLLDYCSLI
jgi:hypothetical protein